MTNEEIITRLNGMKDYYNDRREPYYVGFDYVDNEAIDMAIKVLEQTRWIPVSERLPENEGCYFVYDNHGRIDTSFWDNIGFLSRAQIIAWMPLPKPYKESEDIR